MHRNPPILRRILFATGRCLAALVAGVMLVGILSPATAQERLVYERQLSPPPTAVGAGDAVSNAASNTVAYGTGVRFSDGEVRPAEYLEDARAQPSAANGALPAAVPAALPGADRHRILPPRLEASPTEGQSDWSHPAGETAAGRTPPIFTTLAGLAVVLGAFFVFAWVLRRSLPRSVSPLPANVVEVLGRAPLGAQHIAHLMRVGNKLVLVSVSKTGVETLTEITDPLEVDRLTGICAKSDPSSASQTFRGVLQSFASETGASRS